MTQPAFDLFEPLKEMVTVQQASEWATAELGRYFTSANLTYLVENGYIPGSLVHGDVMVSTDDVERYYLGREDVYTSLYGESRDDEVDWYLAFNHLKEAETTKHVHRLHPYKGKFIPQLVEYFIDQHTDGLKSDVFFHRGDIILDPFCGSGTTLVQSSESGLHAVGLDVSAFNATLSNIKLSHMNLGQFALHAYEVEQAIGAEPKGQRARELEGDLGAALREFNREHFPQPKGRRWVLSEAAPPEFIRAREDEFLPTFRRLCTSHGVSNSFGPTDSFIDRWYLDSVRAEIQVAQQCIEAISSDEDRDLLRLILSRTVRSGRATEHMDLTTLAEPVSETYYCRKHYRICRPVLSLHRLWRRYASDTINRMKGFSRLRSDTSQVCLTGDSRNLEISAGLEESSPELARMVAESGIRGIFTSPPYVGMIDYHEQHAYAYEIFGLPRNDNSEIGPKSRGQSKVAQSRYVEDIARVLLNCVPYMVPDYHVFLVSNDRYDLYPKIADVAGMRIEGLYNRPVVNRVEGDRAIYVETIFHLRPR